MVEAQDRRAIEGHVLHELDERVLDPVEAAIMVEMLGIDIGDDRDRAVEPEKAAVAFVGLDHHPFAVAESRVRPVIVDDAPVDDGGIDAACIEHRRDHRGGRGLAVRAGHRDSGFEAHQLSQHLGAADDGDAVLQRQIDFGIAALDRGGGDHHGGVPQILRLVADHHLDAALAQAFDDIAFGNVRTLHLVAQIVHHLGNARHTDAADADEMDGTDVDSDALHASCPSASRARASPPRAWPLAAGATRIMSASGAAPKLSTRSARSRTALG